MGNSSTSLPCSLSRDEIVAYVNSTTFTYSEVKALWYHFQTISENENQITRK